MAVPHFDRSVNAEAVSGALAEHGCAIIDCLVEPSTMDALRLEMKPHIDTIDAGVDEFGGFHTKRAGALVARSVTARELLMNPLVLETVNAVLGHSTTHQVHLTQVIAIGPDETAQMIHRDQWAFDFFKFPKGYEVQCNTLWAGTDFTEENGATRVIPGSNHFDDGLRFEVDETVPAEMEKGSVLLYTGSLYHGGGANRSDEVRVGVNLTYNLGWLRQEENQYLAVPPEVVAELDDEILKLLGYARGAYALGYVGDLQHPLDYIRGIKAGSGFSMD